MKFIRNIFCYLFLILSSTPCCAHSCSLEPEDEAGEDLCAGDDDDDDDLEQHMNEVKREYMTWFPMQIHFRLSNGKCSQPKSEKIETNESLCGPKDLHNKFYRYFHWATNLKCENVLENFKIQNRFFETSREVLNLPSNIALFLFKM